MEQPFVDLRSVFATIPGSNVLLLPDAPNFTVIGVSDDYSKATGKSREELMGKGLFVSFPNNPADPNQISEKTVRASLEYVLHHKEAHHLPIQRYDIPNAKGFYEERYWSSNNQPIFNEAGEVLYLIHHIEDVTAQIKSREKEAEAKSIEKAYSLFMQAPVAVCIVSGPEYMVELANQHMLQLLGRTTEMVGKRIEESLTEARLQGLIAILDQVRSTGESYHIPNFSASILIDGVRQQRYFDLVFQPFFHGAEDEEQAGIFCVAHNVTRQILTQKMVEELQQETERQKRLYETITSNTPDLIYVLDKSYRFTYANEALLRMWGKTWDEAIGNNFLENGYEPSHARMHEREIDQVVSTKQPIRGEVSFPHSSLGDREYDYIFVPVLDKEGEVEAIVGTTRDITEIKRAEQKVRQSEESFRKLADEAPMFVFIIEADPLAPVSYWNKTWLQYTGQSLEEAKGRAWEGIIHPDDLSVVLANYVPAFENKVSYFIPAIRVKRSDGVYRWHAFKGNPRYLPGGEFNGFVGVGFDIHEQKLSEEAMRLSETSLQQKVADRTAELQKAVEELKRSNANLEDFAYAASHDLKEPVRKIHFFADRLKQQLEGILSEEQRRHFDRLENSARRMGSLIDDLLSYSQATRGLEEKEEVDLHKKLQLVLGDLDLEVQQRNAVITFDHLPTIIGSKRQMQQLFQNLITNALKYSKPEMAPRIHISCRQVWGSEVKQVVPAGDHGKSFHLIEVKDNGIGFLQEDAQRIFNVFTRLHGNAEYRGTGVGLSIAQKVVHNHNGYIWAESTPGAGATFKILLPPA